MYIRDALLGAVKLVLFFQAVWFAKTRISLGVLKDVLQKAYFMATTNYLLAPTFLSGLSSFRDAVLVGLEGAFVCRATFDQITSPKLYAAMNAYLNSNRQDARSWPPLFENYDGLLADEEVVMQLTTRSSCLIFYDKLPIWIKKDAQLGLVSMATLRGNKAVLLNFAQQCVKAAPSTSGPCVYHSQTSKSGCSTSWKMANQLAVKDSAKFCFSNDDASNVFEFLHADLKRFLESKAWYNEKNVAYRRGYLLHGPPGTGKTTLIAQLACTLGLNLCILDLAEDNLTDSLLSLRVENAPSKSIFLIEDVDSALPEKHSKSTKIGPTPSSTSPTSPTCQVDKSVFETKSSSSVTLRGILAILDGQLSKQDAHVFFLTTNFKDDLPKNMIRPGRCDVDRKIDLASLAQSAFVFRKFFPESTEDDLAELHRHVKPLTHSLAELEAHCICFRESPRSALDNLGLLGNHGQHARLDFFEYLARVGLHKTWHKFVEANLLSLHDINQLSDLDVKDLELDVLGVENSCYTPRIAKRFNDFLKHGSESIAKLAKSISCSQVAVVLAGEFQLGNSQAVQEAQKVISAFPNLSYWQLRRGISLCPRNLARLFDALNTTVKTKKDRFNYSLPNNTLDMKTFCWHAGLWDLHTYFGSKTVRDVLQELKSSGKADFTSSLGYLTFNDAKRVCSAMLGAPNFYTFVRTKHNFLASCFLLLASCFLLLASCFLLLASCFLLLAFCFLLFASCFLLLAFCFLLLAFCFLLFASCFLLFASCFLLLAFCSLFKSGSCLLFFF